MVAVNRWTVARYGVQRVAGLPEDVLALLRTPRAAAAADAASAWEVVAAASAAALADALHTVVPTVEPAVRRHLLALRRSAFAGRLRPLGPAAADALAVDHPQVLRLLDRARADEADREIAAAAAADALAVEQELVRSAVRTVSEDEELRRALCVASPLAVRALQREARGGTTSRKDAARLDRTLQEYVCRAAVKTSPFSGLTTVAPVRFTEAASAVPAVTTGPVAAPARVRRVQLSTAFLQRLADQVADEESSFLDLPLRLSPSVRRDEDFVRTIQRRRTAPPGSGAGEVGLDSDRLLLLRDTAVLRDVLTVVRDAGPTGTPVRDLLAALADRVGRDDVERLQALRALVRVGVVECELLRIPVHAPDPARAVAAAVRGLPAPWARDLADRLEALAVLVDRYAGEDAQDRPRTEEEVRSSARTTLESVGGTGERVPATVLYEDVLAPAVPVAEVAEVVLPPAARADLAVVADLARALDPLEPHRQHLAGFFVARFGAGAEHGDVEVLFEDFAEDLYDEYVRWVPKVERFDADGTYAPHANWLGLPAVTALDEARRGLRDLLAARTTSWVAQGRPAHGVALTHEDLAGVLAALPPDTRATATANAFLQQTGADEGPGWVLNKVYGGPGFGWSRFAGLLGHDEVLLKEFCDQLRPTDGTGALPVEVLGGEARSNLNVHPPLVPHVLRTPGDPALPAELHVLTVDDLLVRHDVRTGVLELRSRRLDRPVLPVYLGYLVPQALPDTARALLLFAPSTAPVLDLFAGVAVEPDEFGTVRRPRLAVGDVVVSRASWTVPVPAAGPDWAADRAWVRSLGIPPEGFTTTSPDGRPRTAKPRYHHLDAPSTWAALRAGSTPGDHLTFFERLPGAPAPGTPTRELVVELTRQETP
ncbi:lantibiotic dehydratase [Kineococcus halophytocola]|uniref:lantibiotic dehydratase n=1 Tax=Kineococcus halophytocola TaxID=3234027 RepID=UPI00351A54CF